MAVNIEQFNDVPMPPYSSEDSSFYDGNWEFGGKELGLVLSKNGQRRNVIHAIDKKTQEEVMTLEQQTIRQSGAGRRDTSFLWQSTFVEKGLPNVSIGSGSPSGELFKRMQKRAKIRRFNNR